MSRIKVVDEIRISGGKIQSLNVLKFIMAVFVIMTHTLCLTDMHNFVSDTPILVFVIRVAVPVFFIISGFLLFRRMKIGSNKIDNERIRRYLLKILLLYIIFYLLYSFIAWYIANQASVGFGEFLRFQIRKFLFTGESSYSWALWYLHGLIIAVLMVWITLRIFPRIKPSTFLAIAVIVWMLGIVIELIGEEKMGRVPGYNTFIFLFERVQRNGIFTGFPFVAIGLWLSQIKNVRLSVGWVCIAIGLIFGLLGQDFGRMPLAIGIVYLVVQVCLKDRTVYSYMGFVSKWMFLLHMAFIFVYTVIICHRTDSTMGGYEWGLFGFALVSSLTCSTVIWLVAKSRSEIRKMA